MTEAPAALSSDVAGLGMHHRNVLPGFDKDSDLPSIHHAFLAIAQENSVGFHG